MRLEWDIEGEKQLSKRLRITSDGIKDFSKPFQQTKDYLISAFEKSFDSRGSNIGVSWPPLSASTIKQKGNSNILIQTGKMRSGFTGMFNHVMASVWNTIPYFMYHQSNQARTRLPRRAMMNLGKEQKETIVKFFQAYIQSINK